VNDTTSNPDDRDRADGAAVATGEQTPPSGHDAHVGGTNGSGESHGAHEPEARTANGAAGNGSSGDASAAAPPSPRPSPRPDPVGQETPADGAEPVVEDPPEVPSSPVPGGPARPASEAPTTTMRLPSGPPPARPLDDDVTHPVAPQPAVPTQAGPPHNPGPVNGPVPGPGPAAAAPPPWQRVPGQPPRPQPPQPQPERSRPVGGLLEDEGPTAFLEAPAPVQDGAPAQQNGALSGVRAVRGRQPRQAALQLKRLDPWSVLKLALVLAVVLFLIWLVAVGVLYGVLNGMGVWDRLNGTYADLVSGEAPTGTPLISAGRVFGIAAVVGAINSLLFAVAITVGAFVYNVSADLVGGIEVTLSERD
jgi:hypothetical protein